MLSIFDHKESEPQPDKKPTLDRLQHVLGPQRATATQDRAAAPAAVAEQPPVRPTPVPPTSWQRKPAPQRQETPPAPVATREERKPDANPAELQQFAEQFTRSFQDGLSQAVKDIYTLVAEDRRRVETLHNELDEASQSIGSLVSAQQELAAMVGKAEDAVSIFSSATHATQDQQEQTEKRLELQAGVIRALHSMMQSQEERLDKILASFQALQSVSGETSASKTLPAGL
jgi:hypothetical protein